MEFTELYINTKDSVQNQKARHSGESRNPDNYQDSHAVGQHLKHGFVRYADLYDKLDSGLRRNDGYTTRLGRNI